MDSVSEIELLLNSINMLHAKCTAMNNNTAAMDLCALRKQLYYSDFDKKSVLKKLEQIRKKLNKKFTPSKKEEEGD